MPPKPRPAAERFWKYVRKTETCWLWTGGRHRAGYGSFSLQTGVKISAHRFAYELLVGPIPPGLQLDHLCRTHACVRPDHLEPVTQQENIRRGEAGKQIAAIQRAKTHCPRGHEYSAENTYRNRGERACRTCGRDAARIYQRRRRAQARLTHKEQNHGR